VDVLRPRFDDPGTPRSQLFPAAPRRTRCGRQAPNQIICEICNLRIYFCAGEAPIGSAILARWIGLALEEHMILPRLFPESPPAPTP